MSKTKKEEFSISEEKVGKVKPFLWVYYVIVIVFLVIVIPFFIFDKPVVEEKIIKDPSCGDGTGFDSCSEEKPYFCQEGILLEKASVCGCSSFSNKSGESCISFHETYPQSKSFRYLLNGVEEKIDFITYIGMAEYLSKVSRSIDYFGDEKPSRVDFKLKMINNEEQRELVMPLVKEIQNMDNNSVNQARIAISLVQNIPYNKTGKEVSFGGGKIGYSLYPYEVLHYNQGICGEKSVLMVFLLKELGYGTAIFYFPEENHEAVGIKCPIERSFRKTGYCFVETSGPAVITDSSLEYVGGVRLKSEPEVIVISEGISLPGDMYEYRDAKTLRNIRNANVFGLFEFWKFDALKKKYGLDGEYGLV